MEHEQIKCPEDDVEDGEISDSDDGYTPLARPDASEGASHHVESTDSVVSKMEGASDKDESLPEPSSSDDSDSDGGPRGKSSKKSKIRVKALSSMNPVAPKIKKNNIWASGLQEESLMENLKGCGVDQETNNYDRSVESYDYSLKYRLDDSNPRKRRQSTNSESSNDQQFSCFNPKQSKNKRFRANSMGTSKNRNVRLRLGNKSDDSSSSDGPLNAPRIIMDLNVLNASNEDLARDLANKLYEEKGELLLRIVTILGSTLPLQIFKETQQIERLGGMLIMNGQRRRTPGGVFLYLLKNSADLQHDHKKQIFAEESKKHAKDLKISQALKRDRKVEALKKTLKNETKDLPVLSTRGELSIKDDSLNNLSNPPPSPVTDGNRENSSDFDTHDIQHVNVTGPEKAGPSKDIIGDLRQAAELAQQNQQRMLQMQQSSTASSYKDDDFLDMHCDDMDLF